MNSSILARTLGDAGSLGHCAPLEVDELMLRCYSYRKALSVSFTIQVSGSFLREVMFWLRLRRRAIPDLLFECLSLT